MKEATPGPAARHPAPTEPRVTDDDLRALLPAVEPERTLDDWGRSERVEGLIDRTIYDFLETQLKGDEELGRLNHLEKERLMNRSTAATNDKIRERLAKFIKTRLKEGIKTGGGPSTTKGTGKTEKPHRPTKPAGVIRPPRKTDDSALPKVPTYIRFEKDHVRLVQGGSRDCMQLNRGPDCTLLFR